MPKVKKKNIGGNPIIFAKNAKKLYDSINTLKKEKEDLYNALINKVKNNDINGIRDLLETELMNIDSNSSKDLKSKIEKVKKIYDSIPVEQLEQILKSTISKDIGEQVKELVNSKDIGKQVKGLENKVKNKLETGTKELNKKIEKQKTQGERIDNQYEKEENRSLGNPIKNVLDSEHRDKVEGLGNNNLKDGNNSSGINLGFSEPPENTSNSPAIYIMIAIAMKGILRYIWNLFVVTVKTSYRVLTDFILIPFYIFLPYVFDVLAVFIILIMLILVILYFVSGGGSKKTRSPGNPFDSIISGISSIISNFFNPDLSGVTELKELKELKDNIESDATSFVDVIKNIIKEIIIAPILRIFIPNPNINDINEKDKEKRKENDGRCDNISQIESKDGRYCYKQLKQKNTIWGDNITIPYKLFDSNDMNDPTPNTHYDYYMPNCKINNNFKNAVIHLDTKDNRRTKFICKI